MSQTQTYITFKSFFLVAVSFVWVLRKICKYCESMGAISGNQFTAVTVGQQPFWRAGTGAGARSGAGWEEGGKSGAGAGTEAGAGAEAQIGEVPWEKTLIPIIFKSALFSASSRKIHGIYLNLNLINFQYLPRMNIPFYFAKIVFLCL